MRQYSLLLLSLSIFLILSCRKNNDVTYKKHTGNVFGTTYQIQYGGANNYKPAFDSLFNEVNLSLSTYIPNSIISKINTNDSTVVVDDLFKEVFEKSERIYKETEGYFDPTVGNLVNAWGFGPEKGKKNLDKNEIKEQMLYVGFSKIRLENNKVIKQFPEMYLDFNSIAKGYGIDVISRFLEDKGVEHYLVEIGGEIRAMGVNSKGKLWKIGIDNPNTDGTRSISRYISLDNQSLAGSGNYRKYRIADNGAKYVHTVNPKTGLAEESNLLSATVYGTKDCADVDAYATAFMAMGLENTKSFLKSHPDLKVVLLYADGQGKINEYSN